MTGDDHPIMLAWHVAGTLPAEESAVVEEHLSGCAECREVRESLLLMRETLLAESRAHVPPEDLVAFVESMLPPDRETMVRQHIAACSECRDDSERIERAGSPAGPGRSAQGSIESRRRGLRRGALPAAAAVLVLSSAVILWALRPSEPPVEAIRSVTLLPATRGAAAEAALDGPGPWVATIVLPATAPAGEYRVEIRDGSGSAVADDVTARTEPGHEVSVLIRRLPAPGEYELILRPVQAAPGAPYRYSFRLGD